MLQAVPATLGAAATVLLTLPVRPLFEDDAWVADAVLGVLVVLLSGLALRWLTSRAVLVVGGQALASGAYLLHTYVGETTAFGLPTAATIGAVGELVTDAQQTITEYAAPAPLTPGVAAMLGGIVVLVALATFVGLLFYVTSADSGALVMANLSSDLPDNDTDAAPAMRIVWAAATGVLTIAMLTVDGIPALQSATIIMGLPFAFVMILVMWALHRALEEDRVLGVAQRVSLTRSLVGHPSGSGSWRRRLSRTFGTVTVKQAEERLDDVVLPSLHEVAGELTERGVTAEVSEDTGTGRIGRTAKLAVPATEIGYGDFCYLVQVRRTPAPSYGARMLEADDTTTLLEVALPTGVSYDLMDYDGDEVCHDVLDHYERWANSSAAVADHGS